MTDTGMLMAIKDVIRVASPVAADSSHLSEKAQAIQDLITPKSFSTSRMVGIAGLMSLLVGEDIKAPAMSDFKTGRLVHILIEYHNYQVGDIVMIDSSGRGIYPDRRNNDRVADPIQNDTYSKWANAEELETYLEALNDETLKEGDLYRFFLNVLHNRKENSQPYVLEA